MSVVGVNVKVEVGVGVAVVLAVAVVVVVAVAGGGGGGGSRESNPPRQFGELATPNLLAQFLGPEKCRLLMLARSYNPQKCKVYLPSYQAKRSAETREGTPNLSTFHAVA